MANSGACVYGIVLSDWSETIEIENHLFPDEEPIGPDEEYTDNIHRDITGGISSLLEKAGTTLEAFEQVDYHDFDFIFIGMALYSMGDDETKAQFQDRVRAEFKKLWETDLGKFLHKYSSGAPFWDEITQNYG